MPGQRINWSHPIARGLDRCWMFGAETFAQELVHGQDNGVWNGTRRSSQTAMGPAALFNNNNSDYIGISYPMPAVGTYEFWFQLVTLPTSTGNDNMIIGKDSATGSVLNGLFISTVANKLAWWSSGAFQNFGVTALTVGPIYHAVVIYNASNVIGYLNGKLESSVASGNQFSTMDHIGCAPLDVDKNGIAIIAGRTWSRQLSAGEILQLYNDPWGMFRRPVFAGAAPLTLDPVLRNANANDGSSTITLSVVAGDLILLAIADGSTSPTHGVTDGASNTWVQAQSVNDSVDGASCDVWYCLSAKTTATITVTVTGGGGSRRLGIECWNPNGFTAALDQKGGKDNSSSGAAWDSGNVTTTVAKSTLFGAMRDSAGQTLIAGTTQSYSLDAVAAGGASSNRIGIESVLITSTGTVQADFTSSAGGAATAAVVIATFGWTIPGGGGSSVTLAPSQAAISVVGGSNTVVVTNNQVVTPAGAAIVLTPGAAPGVAWYAQEADPNADVTNQWLKSTGSVGYSLIDEGVNPDDSTFIYTTPDASAVVEEVATTDTITAPGTGATVVRVRSKITTMRS